MNDMEIRAEAAGILQGISMEKLLELFTLYQMHVSQTKNVDSNHISDFVGWAAGIISDVAKQK